MSVYGMDSGRNLHPVYTKEEITTILQQLINGGTLAGVDPSLTPIVAAMQEENGGVISFWAGTESKYNAIKPAPEAKEIVLRLGAGGKLYLCTDSTIYTDHLNAATASLVNRAGEIAAEMIDEANSILSGKQNKHVAKTVVLSASGWVDNAQTVSIEGVTASNTVQVGSAPESAEDYGGASIICTAQAENALTFTCKNAPTNDVTVNVIIWGV